MSLTICISANTFYYPKGGGHMWVYLNWALGFKAAGCKVIWLEEIDTEYGLEHTERHLASLKNHLQAYGLDNCVSLWCVKGIPFSADKNFYWMDLETAAEQADLLINQHYGIPQSILSKFKRTALLDIDPGLTQMWASKNYLTIATHDVYFTIGETVAAPDAKFPDAGIHWHYTPPCVSLDYWPLMPTVSGTPLTTVSHWSMDEWEYDNGEIYSNDKRMGFLPYFSLPKYSSLPLELAILFGDGEEGERRLLQKSGWRVKDSHSVAATPQDYQKYIQQSAGEFSCVKPSCVRLQNAWISDRTLCYLASGKPAIVEHTGPSKFLPDNAGLFRFKNFEEAITCIEEVKENYDKHCKLARALAEEYFDAKKVTKNLLERAL